MLSRHELQELERAAKRGRALYQQEQRERQASDHSNKTSERVRLVLLQGGKQA